MITMGRGRRRILTLAGAATAAVSVLAMSGCSGGDGGGSGTGGDGGDVTIEFAQWWEPELPDGEFRALIDKFEDENPGIKVDLVSGPYASTKEQLFAGAASGTMPDVVGLDGAWVNDFASQGVIADLSALMKKYDYDDSELASQIQVDGSTYMIPVVNFVYPMFTNDTLLAEAGVTTPPSTRNAAPLTPEARGLAMNAVSAAISSGDSKRCRSDDGRACLKKSRSTSSGLLPC